MGTNEYVTLLRNNGIAAHVRKNYCIFSQGEPAHAVFYIDQGYVCLSVDSACGQRTTLSWLGPRSFFGETCIGGHCMREETAIAKSDCLLIKIEVNKMRECLQDRTLSNAFTRHLLERNASLQDDLLDMRFNRSEKRLIRALLFLAQLGQKTGSFAVIQNVSHNMLSEAIGTTRSHVSIFMNKFRKLGLVEYQRGILKVHSDLLQEWLERPCIFQPDYEIKKTSCISQVGRPNADPRPRPRHRCA